MVKLKLVEYEYIEAEEIVVRKEVGDVPSSTSEYISSAPAPAIDKALDKKVKSVYTTVPIFSGSGFGLGLIDEGYETIL